MKEATHNNKTLAATRRAPGGKRRTRCSICSRTAWFDAVPLMEPLGVPEPRRSWTLCQDCYRSLVDEMRKSPVRSPLRLRIAMGIVASERWPQAHETLAKAEAQDQRKLVMLAWTFIVIMLLHLTVFVLLPLVH